MKYFAKSHKARFPIALLILVFALMVQTVAHPYVGNQERLMYQGSKKVFRDSTVANIRFLESDFDNGEFKRTTFENCEFRYRQYVSYLSAETLRFVNCAIPELAFSFGRFKQIIFTGCTIGALEFKDISNLEGVEFRKCQISEVRFLRSNVTNVTFALSECDRLNVEDCHTDGIRYSTIGLTQVIMRRGVVRNLDISDFKDNRISVTFEYVELHTPNLSPDIAALINFRKTLIPDDFMMMQDFQADIGAYGTSISRESYADAIAIYSIIKSQFKEIGVKRVERRMEYLLKSAERKALQSPVLRALIYVWDEQLRGFYGTSPMVVLRTTFWLWLLFSIIYFIMGNLRVCWGASIEVSLLGDTIEGAIPAMIVHRIGLGPWEYLVACLSFSIDQLLVVGFRQGFRVSHFTEHLVKIPRRYFGIGFGRIMAVIENVVGLILLFNFVQAFLNTL